MFLEQFVKTDLKKRHIVGTFLIHLVCIKGIKRKYKCNGNVQNYVVILKSKLEVKYENSSNLC